MKDLISIIAAILFATLAQAATITLTWSDNSDNEEAFEIERSEETPPNFLPIGTVGADVTTFADTTPLVGVEYSYRVRAVNEFGFSGFSNTAVAIGKDDSVPSDPDGLKAEDSKPVLVIVTDPETGGVTITPIIQ